MHRTAFASSAGTAGWQQLAAALDHTLLKPDARRAAVAALCAEAARYRFACAMVHPAWVPMAVSELRGTGVPVGVVLGFPLGASLPETKRTEAAALVRLGAHDLDMVLQIGMLASGMDAEVEADIRGVVEIAHAGGAIVKVILETCLLDDAQKRRGAELALVAGADFLKTSTGFASGGATPTDVALLRNLAGGRARVKASGGIRTLADARAMLSAGADRIGASAGVALVRELGAPVA